MTPSELLADLSLRLEQNRALPCRRPGPMPDECPRCFRRENQACGGEVSFDPYMRWLLRRAALVEKMANALMFYADPATYQQQEPDGWYPISEDEGRRAEKALRPLKQIDAEVE